MPGDEPPQVGDDLVAQLEQLAAELAGRDDSGDVAHRFEWLVDVLIQRGHLAPGHRRLIAAVKNEGPRSSVKLAMFRDKRAIRGADIDCAARLPLCKGRCCSFTVSLSVEDVREGKLPWMISEPYVLPKHPTTGYCSCLGADGACMVYEDRPGTCRTYDCRHDRRVWLDFEQRIPAPMPPGLVPPAGAADPGGDPAS